MYQPRNPVLWLGAGVEGAQRKLQKIHCIMHILEIPILVNMFTVA